MTLEQIIWTALCGTTVLIIAFVKSSYNTLDKRITKAENKAEEVNELTTEIVNNYVSRFGKLEVMIANTEKTIVQTISDKFDTLQKDIKKDYVSKDVFNAINKK